MSGTEFSNNNNIGIQKSQVGPAGPHPQQQVMHLSFGPPVAGNGNGEGMNINMGDSSKKKRGRPRKYGSEGPIPVPLSSVHPHQVNISQPSPTTFSSPPPPPPPPPQQQQMIVHGQPQQEQQHQMLLQQQRTLLQQQQQGGPPAGGAAAGGGSVSPSMKKRGRPPGSANKPKPKQHQQQQQQQESFGALGIGFTPHVITVNTGEDVASRIMSFSQTGPRAICILSAIGAISNVTLRQAATSGGSVTYEGRFEILSLSGTFMLSDSGGGPHGRSGGLSVSLAGPDGRVLGGGVAGVLTAASPVQVVVGSFFPESQRDIKVGNLTEPVFSPPKSYAGSRPTGPSSPPSRGTLSESSGGAGSPLNQSTGAVNSTPLGMSNLPWK